MNEQQVSGMLHAMDAAAGRETAPEEIQCMTQQVLKAQTMFDNWTQSRFPGLCPNCGHGQCICNSEPWGSDECEHCHHYSGYGSRWCGQCDPR